MGWPEIVLLLVIVLLVFGVGRISKVAEELGQGIRAFREGLSSNAEETQDSDEEKDTSEDQI